MAFNRTIGMLSGDPRVGMQEQAISRGERLGSLFGGAVNQAVGRDMRTPEQVARAEAGKQMAQATDPNKTSAELFQIAQGLMAGGMVEQGTSVLRMAEAKRQEEQKEVQGGYDKASAIKGLNTLVDSGKITDAKRTQLINGVTSGAIPFDTIKQYVAREMGLAGPEKETSKAFKGEIYKDDEGNMYRTVTRVSGKGAVDEYIPIGSAPPYKKQPLKMVYGETGMTYLAGKQTQTDLEQQEAENQKFGELKVAAAAALPDLLTSSSEIDRALELLQTVETGGPINTAGTALENFTGTMSADKAELQVILGNAMYRQLKPLFGGVISEGERTVIENLYASLKKGNPANTGILRDMARAIKSSVGNSRELLKADTFSEYQDLLLKLSEPSENKGTTVNWNDL